MPCLLARLAYAPPEVMVLPAGDEGTLQPAARIARARALVLRLEDAPPRQATRVEREARMTDLDADTSVNAVVFQTPNTDLFIAHLDVSKATEQP